MDKMLAQRTILIADDHPLFREALKFAVEQAAPDARTIEAGAIAETLDVLRGETDVDLILLDLKMSDSAGFAGLASIRAERPDVPVIVVTASEKADYAPRARQYGAAGFLSKTAPLPEICAVVNRALRREDTHDTFNFVNGVTDQELDRMATRIASLTPAQLKVLMGLLEGRLNKQIAYDMGISEATVKAHMTAVFRKLNVRNRTQAVLAAQALSTDAPMTA
jgi:DNA-binding NarL/FixJ family response regulator